jgi:hypothetical protein
MDSICGLEEEQWECHHILRNCSSFSPSPHFCVFFKLHFSPAFYPFLFTFPLSSSPLHFWTLLHFSCIPNSWSGSTPTSHILYVTNLLVEIHPLFCTLSLATACHLLSLGLSLSLPPPTECGLLAASFRPLCVSTVITCNLETRPQSRMGSSGLQLTVSFCHTPPSGKPTRHFWVLLERSHGVVLENQLMPYYPEWSLGLCLHGGWFQRTPYEQAEQWMMKNTSLRLWRRLSQDVSLHSVLEEWLLPLKQSED